MALNLDLIVCQTLGQSGCSLASMLHVNLDCQSWMWLVNLKFWVSILHLNWVCRAEGVPARRMVLQSSSGTRVWWPLRHIAPSTIQSLDGALEDTSTISSPSMDSESSWPPTVSPYTTQRIVASNAELSCAVQLFCAHDWHGERVGWQQFNGEMTDSVDCCSSPHMMSQLRSTYCLAQGTGPAQDEVQVTAVLTYHIPAHSSNRNADGWCQSWEQLGYASQPVQAVQL